MGRHRSRIARIAVVGLGAVGLVAVAPTSADAAATYSVTATVPVGARPYAVAVDSTRHIAYVANYLDGTVSVIDEATNTVTNMIKVGAAPDGVAVDAGRGLVFVVNGGSDDVSIIDETTNQVVRKVGVERNPTGVAVDPLLGRVFVGNNGSHSLSVIDEASLRVRKTFRFNGGSFHYVSSLYALAVDPAQSTLYGTDPTTGYVFELNDKTYEGSSQLIGGTPTGIAVDTATHTPYIANANGTVYVPGTVGRDSGEVLLGDPVYALAVDPAEGTVTAVDFSGGVSVIDVASRTVLTTVYAGRSAFGMGFDDGTHTAVIANSRDATVSMIGMTGVLPPRVSSNYVPEGGQDGGRTITITGEGFANATAVRFASFPAASFTVDSPRQITAVTPAHAPGVVDIHVEGPGGVSLRSVGDQYRFVPRPRIASVSPNSGPVGGGQLVTITGTNLYEYPNPVVRFGNVQAHVYTDSDTKLVVVSPPNAAGPVDIVVTADSGTSLISPSDQYTYTP